MKEDFFSLLILISSLLWVTASWAEGKTKSELVVVPVEILLAQQRLQAIQIQQQRQQLVKQAKQRAAQHGSQFSGKKPIQFTTGPIEFGHQTPQRKLQAHH